jgi:Flp pilus assembly protein TadG
MTLMKTSSKRSKMDMRCRLGDWRRRGAAAVELAVVSPVLLLTAIGIIDVGQFVSVGQIVNNASREGARAAIRNDTGSVSQVEAAVLAYMTDAIGGVSREAIRSALHVGVTGDNRTLAAGDLTLVSSGSKVQVVVAFDYQDVRWAPSSFFGATTVLQATSIARRE